MPRRKKTDQSPARVPDGPPPPPEWGSLGHTAGYPAQPPGGQQASTASYFIPSGTSISSADKEKVVKSMQEMFSHLDPEVIYIVLSECDFKVENAMDSLLELSVAAEVAAPVPSPVSGFERTAAALLNPRLFSEASPKPEVSKSTKRLSSPSSGLLTEELDLVVDQELQTLTAQQGATERPQSSTYLDADTSRSSFPPPPLLQQDLPELLQSSLESGSRGPPAERSGPAGRVAERLSAASSPLRQQSTWEKEPTQGEQSVVDFTHLMTDASPDKAKLSFDLATSGRPSAFQVYKKQEPPQATSDGPGLLYSDAVGGARSKIKTINQEPVSHVSSAWNLDAPAFSPGGYQCQPLNNSGAHTAPNWFGQPRHMSPWLNTSSVSQAPLKPYPAIPKSWALPAAPQAPPHHSRLRLEGRVLVLLRGAPGSGKSTLARALLDHNPGGVVLGTDDYFTRNGQYQFDPTLLGEAHEWNHKRAKEAFAMGKNPIIIDNTNMQGWEMRPYVAQALRHGYKVLFKEPDTWWKNKPRELERRSKHSVPVETIRRMLNGYERFVTIQNIMGSRMPEWKHRLLPENKSTQPVSSESPCPDLVDQPSLTEQLKKSRSQLFSSLPDVSSIGQLAEARKLEEGGHKSTESLNFQLTVTSTDNPNLSDGEDIDLGSLDSELDARLQQDVNNPAGDQRMPDCIVESVMNEDHCVDELPVAFSESIQQRAKRERPSRRSEFYKNEPVDLVKDTNQSERDGDGKENIKDEKAEAAEMVKHEEEKASSKLLDFVGDWPSEGPLNQRQVRKRAVQVHNNDCSSQEAKEDQSVSVHSGPNGFEFQKLLDLIQTGIVKVQADSSHLHSLSPISGEALERDNVAGGSCEESHSSSEEKKQDMKQGRGELPDCVLDWKAAESCMARESKNDHSEGLRIETEARSESSATVKEAFSESHSINSEAGTDAGFCSSTDIDRECRAEAPVSSNGEACQSPVCESESSPMTGSSQEKKQRQGRRSGKQCKLALTFTQNCSDSSPNTADSPNTSSQNLMNGENTCNSDVAPNTDPDIGLDPKPNSELPIESEADLKPLTPPLLEDTGCFTQTEPQDFALLWRLNRQTGPEDPVVAAGSHCSDVAVLSGEASRFVPELSSAVSAADAVHPSGHREVPYRVVHEKGMQVEEKEFVVTQDRLESLRILSRHFKLVSFDTLEDLYDKCQQDLEWTTNLLLDSGERFFRDEDGLEEEEEDVAADKKKDDNSRSGLCGAPQKMSLCPNVLEENKHNGEPTVIKEGALLSPCEGDDGSGENATNTNASRVEGGGDTKPNECQSNSTTNLEKSLQTEPSVPTAGKEEERSHNTVDRVMSGGNLAGGGSDGSPENGVIIEELRDQIEDEIASMDEVNRLLQAELDEIEREESQRREQRRGQHLDIQSVELKLPTELALQLTELFGPVGVDPGACSAEDCSVQMDLNLAKLLHHKWKETIQERQKQATLSFHLLQEGAARQSDSQVVKPGQRDRTPPNMPHMDHWNVSRPRISLRDIIKEEQALQRNVEKTRESRAELDRRDGATLLKENQLFSLFPNIDKHFIQDIFRDHNYSLAQTELFLRSLLIEEPVKTVVAPEVPRSVQNRGSSKEREKQRQKPVEVSVAAYQDTEDPEYEDFRAEATLQRRRQLESFSKAAEAHKQGRKEVASFYAQQGHLHGQRMREANHRAACQIFERVNSSLLPNNILDLHGLHVDEALQHLAQVLQDKTADYEQGLCRPQLSVITGRGNHSQGGVARIRPAVVDYLTNKHYRFSEPKPGLVLISLK